MIVNGFMFLFIRGGASSGVEHQHIALTQSRHIIEASLGGKQTVSANLTVLTFINCQVIASSHFATHPAIQVLFLVNEESVRM